MSVFVKAEFDKHGGKVIALQSSRMRRTTSRRRKAWHRTAPDDQTVRKVFVISPDKKIKLIRYSRPYLEAAYLERQPEFGDLVRS